MTDAKLGRLKAQILVDDQHRLHHGSQDKITGKVILTYKPQSSLLRPNGETQHLFGPLELFVVLSGKVRTKVRRGDSHRLPTDHSNVLFQHGVKVFGGPFKAVAGEQFEYAFRIGFPQDMSKIYGAPGYAELMGTGNSRSILPLSFSLRFMDHPDAVDVSVLYRLGVQVSMPGIGVDVDVPDKYHQPIINFGLPRPPKSVVSGKLASFKQEARIQNENLLPEDQRPQGFKQKAKAVFTSSHFPSYVMDVTCTYPQYIYPGQQLSFDIVLRRNDKESSSELSPEASLVGFSVDLRSHTIVDVSGRIIGPPSVIDRRTVQTLTCETKISRQISKEQDYTIKMVTDPVLQHVSSFAHVKLSRQYLLRISMQFRSATEAVKIKQDCPVILVPAPEGLDREDPLVGGSSRAGPSRSYIQPPPDDEQLPAYGEASSHTLVPT